MDRFFIFLIAILTLIAVSDYSNNKEVKHKHISRFITKELSALPLFVKILFYSGYIVVNGRVKLLYWQKFKQLTENRWPLFQHIYASQLYNNNLM